jgi:type II secretory pathway component PulF
MPTYEYHAISPAGDEISGRITAAGETAARQELAARELSAIRLARHELSAAGNLGSEHVDTLVQALASTAITRVPLEVSLAALAEEKSDPQLAAVAEQLAARLREGATIDTALGDVEHQLPTEIAGLLRAGVESGDLAGTLERYSQQQLAASRFNRRIRVTLAYPIIIVAILVPTLLFLSLYVIPMFGDLFKEFRLDLPEITELILSVANQLPGLIAGLAILLIGFPIVLRLVGGSWMLHRVRAALPFIGRMWMWAAQREFASQLGSFLTMGLTMPSAVAQTAHVLADRNIARACSRLLRRVESGQSLSTSLDQSIQFDRSLVALVAWGERHGALTEALTVATDLFDDRVEQQASLVRRLLPSLTLVSVATLMFFVLAGLLIPLVRLIEALSR